MRQIEAKNGSTIYVGHQLDNEVTQVVFNADPIYTLYGDDGTFSIYVKRYGEYEGYPVGAPLVTADEHKVYWTLTSTDVAIAGVNECQLRYMIDDKVAMSLLWKYQVQESIVLGDTIPEPMEEWADALAEAASDIVNMTVSAHQSSTPTVEKTGGSGTPYNLDFGLVKGDKGDQGIQGPQGIKGDKGDKGDTGDKGDKGDKGDTGAQGPQGIQGLKGDKGDKGDTGEQGETGPQGPKGDAGEDGKGLVILGHVDSESDLPVDPTAGDAYSVGTEIPYDIYIYDGPNEEWVNNGPIQGPQGPQGETGPQGAVGPQGPQGIQGVKGDTGSAGAKGDKGDKGDQGNPTTVNGKTGASITLDSDDVGAVPVSATEAENAAYLFGLLDGEPIKIDPSKISTKIEAATTEEILALFEGEL